MAQEAQEKLLEEAARKVLKLCAAKSFNERYRICPWDDSNLSKILSPLSEKIAKRLAVDVAVRAIDFRRQYGCHGSKHFGMLRKHHGDMHEEIGQKIKLTKKNYWNVVDICAVNALIPGGQRVGDVQINLYSEKGIKR